MNIQAQVSEAISNLFSSKMRSALALLGILVGTASVVAMVSGGQLATRQALEQFKALGTNLLSVSINYTGKAENLSDPRAKISINTALGLKNASPDIREVAPYSTTYSNVSYNDKPVNGEIIGVTEDLQKVARLKLQQGRFVSLLDHYAFHCVIGEDVFKQIKGSTPNLIGKQLKLGKEYFTIVGVLKKWPSNSFIYANLNNGIFIPIESAGLLSKYAQINNIVMRINPKASPQKIENSVRSYIQQNTIDQRLYFNNAKQILKSMEKQKQILTIFLGFIGGISLLVGGIGVMNIMLVSVTERRREIGIRLAVGAKRRDIQWLFLTESVILSLIGGLLGVLLGILISFIIAETRHWHFMIFLYPPTIGFTVSAFVGIFFGFYPAYKASKLDPIEALHAE